MALDTIHLDRVQAPVKDLILKLDQMFQQKTGEQLVIVSGYRDPSEQQKLYEQGRTAPGEIVTHAQPLSSAHNFGLAVDVVPQSLIAKTEWEPSSPLWQTLGALGKSLGLIWGGDFHHAPDRPHFEWHPGLTLAEIKAYFLKTGQVLLSKATNPVTIIGLAVLVITVFYLWKRGDLS